MWKIKNIFDGDYGCEALAPGEKPKVLVTIINDKGEEKEISVEDDWLTENNLDEGSEWPLIADEDWTKNCNSEKVDLKHFTNMMQNMKKGKNVTWTCPFCGSKVILMQNDAKKTVIGCSNCDMRINLEG
jgi:DNA-directed RNA polymerase subunit RPC12/RpoP